MTTAEARKMFEAAIANAKTAEERDNIRLCMEYFTNEAFKTTLHDFVAEKVAAKA